MRHLGLDLSLTGSGILVYDAAKHAILHKEVAGYGLEDDLPESHRLARMINITKRVVAVVTKYEPQTVTIEGPAYGKFKQTGGRLFQLGGIYYVVATQVKLCFPLLTPIPVGAPTARLAVLGRGMPPKGVKGEAVKKWVKDELWVRHGLDAEQHDCNDALVLAIWRSIIEKDAHVPPPRDKQLSLLGAGCAD